MSKDIVWDDDVIWDDAKDEPGVLAQLVGGAKHSWDKAALALESAVPGGKRLSKALSQPDLAKMVDEGRKFVADTGPASSLGEFAGEMALTAFPAARAAGAISSVPRIGKALADPGFLRAVARYGLEGAAGGATANAMTGNDVGEGAAAGALFGPVIGGVGRAASGVAGMVQDLTGGAIGRATKDVHNIFDGKVDEAISALKALRGHVPGEMPTAGAAASARLPELKALEEAARTRPNASGLLQRDAQNEAARLKVLQDIQEPGIRGDTIDGKIPMSRAEQFRADVTRPIYDKASADRVELTPEIRELLLGREAQPAIGRGERSFGQAQTNARVAGNSVPVGELPGATRRNPTRVVRNPETGEEVAVVNNSPFMPDYGSRSVGELQRIKGQLDKEISSLASSQDGASRLKASQLMEARNQLESELRNQSGTYSLAQTIFKNLSAPQNQADVAGVLANALRNPSGAERPAAFLGAMENAPRTLKRADASPRFERLDQIMSPEQMSGIRGVQRSLQREAEYNNLKAPSGVLPETLSVGQQIENTTPQMLHAWLTALRSGGRMLARQSDKSVQAIVDKAMQNPSDLVKILEDVPPQQRSAIINLLRETQGTGAVTGLLTSHATGEN